MFGIKNDETKSFITIDGLFNFFYRLSTIILYLWAFILDYSNARIDADAYTEFPRIFCK